MTDPLDDSVLSWFVNNPADVIRAFACGPGSRYERNGNVAMADGGGRPPRCVDVCISVCWCA
jgi:hypothetical protein